jgi:hypothetical protein
MTDDLWSGFSALLYVDFPTVQRSMPDSHERMTESTDSSPIVKDTLAEMGALEIDEAPVWVSPLHELYPQMMSESEVQKIGLQGIYLKSGLHQRWPMHRQLKADREDVITILT